MTNSYFVQWLTQQKRYTNVYLLGEGGMGQVFHATDPDLSRELAVKVLLDDVRDEASRARFHNEMKALTKIGSHPGVVQFYSKESTPRGDDVMVMAFIDGKTLGHAIRERAHQGRGFSVAEVVYYLKPIASALDYMHHELHPGWVHRDIKPANILLRKNPGSLPPAVLSDFGISIEEGQSRLTKIGHIVGTEKYLAPENNGNAYGDDDMSARADDYSLALIAFEMLTLHHLKDTMPRSEWEGQRRIPDLSSDAFAELLAGDTSRVVSEVQTVLNKALNSVPMQRYARAKDFIAALGDVSQTRPAQRAAAPAADAPRIAPTPQPSPRPEQPRNAGSAGQPSQFGQHPQPSQRWPEPSASFGSVERARPTGFVSPSNPIASSGTVSPSAPVTPAMPGSTVQRRSTSQRANHKPPAKDNSNALIITVTVVVIILIFVVTWAIVA
ncbi:serine/threonine protein kinase [Corynebacterium aurimucosum]|uniref:non-specific serine/threonine protein kinase n=1 Tax=Corynebacterium aurimucosum (strain ATCC 700975 / DSM 44827 / CIP 107346 / CN-1) TaxID=548476 RepID=C3PF08_CORA7|nr:serine/threonine-protein kinase [Corynebacterium aurimucosum]ACP32412.1 serine/threonine protein kinase PknJ [Corynebacterium aurimucosum ATCC 700975]QQU93406.1 protein kinase [Corynebacterium aurimucosum]